MTEEEYRASVQARTALTTQALRVMEQSTPTPTQEEHDLILTGAIHPDDKTDPNNPEMPPVEAQQEFLANAIADAGTPDPVPTAPPAVVDVPHVSGSTTVGGTLNCTMGNWTEAPDSYAWQWQSDGVAPIGTGGDTYLVVAGDAGHSIGCIVTATNALGSTTAPPSNAVAIPASRAKK